jgi:hypothetical protein
MREICLHFAARFLYFVSHPLKFAWDVFSFLVIPRSGLVPRLAPPGGHHYLVSKFARFLRRAAGLGRQRDSVRVFPWTFR